MIVRTISYGVKAMPTKFIDRWYVRAAILLVAVAIVASSAVVVLAIGLIVIVGSLKL